MVEVEPCNLVLDMTAPKDNLAPTPQGAPTQANLKAMDLVQQIEASTLVAQSHNAHVHANAAAAAVALQLRKSGVMPGSAVSVLVERSFELPVAVFGIWKAGCIYVPCDPAYPEDRLAMYIEDSNSKAVLTTADLKGKAQGLVGNTEATVHLIPEPRTASQKAAAKVTHDLQAEDTA